MTSWVWYGAQIVEKVTSFVVGCCACGSEKRYYVSSNSSKLSRIYFSYPTMLSASNFFIHFLCYAWFISHAFWKAIFIWAVQFKNSKLLAKTMYLLKYCPSPYFYKNHTTLTWASVILHFKAEFSKFEMRFYKNDSYIIKQGINFSFSMTTCFIFLMSHIIKKWTCISTSYTDHWCIIGFYHWHSLLY